jgi:hypothetical protein
MNELAQTRSPLSRLAEDKARKTLNRELPAQIGIVVAWSA